MTTDHHTAGNVGDQLPKDLIALYERRIANAGSPTPGEISPRLKQLPGIRAVLFDVYGTLVQSAAGEISLYRHDEATTPFYRLAEALPEPMSFDRVEKLARRYFEKIEEVHATRRALGVEHPEVDIITIWHALLEEFEELHAAGQTGEFARARWLALRFELEANPVSPMPGARETFSLLADSSRQLGIISNAQFYTPLLFPLLFGASPQELGVEIAVWSYKIGEAKPSPALYREAADWFADAYNLAPEQLLMVGNDLRNDIDPAARVGMKTALFAGDSRSLRLREEDENLKGLEADLVLTSLTQLREVLP